MNARCYGLEIADRFLGATVLDKDLNLTQAIHGSQPMDLQDLPLSDCKRTSSFRLASRPKSLDPAEIQKTMIDHKTDRENKGHFRKPCAGSFFKNNRAFGKPSGQIIDELGLKGLSKRPGTSEPLARQHHHQ
jgi:UDP-N-acetylmuramate dehydrogenase